MFQSLEILRTAMSMAQHAGQKQAISAQNIANSDTPKYQAMDVKPFHEIWGNRHDSLRASRPSHLNGQFDPKVLIERRADKMDPNGNTVSMEQELVNAIDAKRQHDRALGIYKTSLSILRTSINTR